MANIEIPNRFISGFQNLATIPVSIFDNLCKELVSAPEGLSPKGLESYLSKKIAHEGIDQIAITIVSIGNLYFNWETEKEDLIHELVVSFREQSGQDSATLEERLNIIFNNLGKLNKTFKAINLLTEASKIFRKARVITDLRLVFGETIADSNRSAIVIHQLKFDYNENGENLEFYVSLDRKDLKELKNQIERALEKENVIKKDYSSTIPFIDFSEDA